MTDPTLPRPNRFDCYECGPGIAVDEDGCCRTCGRDAKPIVYEPIVATPPRPAKRARYCKHRENPQECNAKIAALEAELSRRQQEIDTLKADRATAKRLGAGYIEQLQSADQEIARLRQALTDAIATIRTWHGMGMGAAEAEAWAQYQYSPEMQRLLSALLVLPRED